VVILKFKCFHQGLIILIKMIILDQLLNFFNREKEHLTIRRLALEGVLMVLDLSEDLPHAEELIDDEVRDGDGTRAFMLHVLEEVACFDNIDSFNLIAFFKHKLMSAICVLFEVKCQSSKIR
jgi:hypothetical protein